LTLRKVKKLSYFIILKTKKDLNLAFMLYEEQNTSFRVEQVILIWSEAQLLKEELDLREMAKCKGSDINCWQNHYQ